MAIMISFGQLSGILIMSSHHFVKEGQEPALFILDRIDFELAGQFLEWAPLVVVSEHALDEVLQWGIKIDAVLAIGEGDVSEHKVSAQAPVEILRLNSEVPMIRQAFEYLISKRQAGVNVLTASPEAVFIDAERVAKKLRASIVDEHLRWVGISTGRFEKWMAINTPIVIRRTVDGQSLTVHGLMEKNDHFVCTEDGMITVASDAFFWIAEPYS